ncbi:FHA domain-containing protein [Streptomyces hainanensis]|uniref:FHA domain-containing protein n=1 Tax=Streptomyces hainanensis TaxID=402648 RepID=A0A4R4T734_9ACTN|nr:FHA domain-containing protein [Streptomyces hainanensis]
MQIRLTVLVHGDAGSGVDVQVTAPADTPLAAVLGPLATAVAPGSATPSVVFCEDRRLDPRRTPLGQPPLVDGAVLAFHRPVEGPGPEPVPGRLLVVAGPDAGGVHLLRGGEARIGRSAEADIPLDDPDVSRVHCAVALGPGGRVTVTDLGSRNGTLLDGRPVAGGPVVMPPGALLRLGESLIRVEAADAVPPPPSSSPAEVPQARRRGLSALAGRRPAEPAEAPAPAGAPAPAEGAAEARWPDLAALLLTALGSAGAPAAGPRLWERGPTHQDAYGVRLGTAQRAAAAPRPVTVSLPEAGSLGLGGPRERVAGVARAALAQLAALHPPSALELVVLAPGRAAEWSWLGWLPHTRPTRGQECRLLLAFDAKQATARIKELTALTAQPAGGRRTVVLVDGDPGTADARAALAHLAITGPAAGVHLIVLAEAPPATPASPTARTLAAARAASPLFRACGTVGLLTGAVATSLRLIGSDGAESPAAGADAVSAAWAERFARALAPVGEETGGQPAAPSPRAPATPLPESCRLLDALELSRVTPGTLRERWHRNAGLPLVLGTGVEGPVAVELADLTTPLTVDGGPGSGRTELVNSLAASLASTLGPRDLSLLLVEGAGDGLRPSAELPHVASYVGATDPVRIRAFARALREELKRRATLLGEADFGRAPTRTRRTPPSPRPAADQELPPMLARGSDPLPWLVVLVDDFDALLTPPLGAPGRQAAGSVLRVLDAVAGEGRRLGVRLILAGGRVAPGSTAWVALTGQPPGRGELRRPGGATAFQAGRVTGRIPRTATLRPTVTRLDWARAGDPPTARPVRELGNGPTDMALLASAAARAAETDHPTATLV